MSGLTLNGTGLSLVAPSTVAASIQIGVTTVAGGTSGYVLYNNAGTLGNLQPTGSGLAVLQTSPALVTPALGVATATSLAIGGATLGANALAVTGAANISSTIVGGATIRAVGTFSTDDGRVQQTSGPVMDMRTADTFRFFQSDNATPGGMQGRHVSTPKTANYQVTKAESGTTFNNIGAAGEVDFTLPTSANTTAGQWYSFVVDAAQILKVIANTGQTIVIANSASSSAGNASNSTAGSVLVIEAVSTTKWVARSTIGTWALA